MIKHIRLKNEHTQLASHEACVKRLMAQHPKDESPTLAQFGDDADNA